jgi:hypothetical protein
MWFIYLLLQPLICGVNELGPLKRERINCVKGAQCGGENRCSLENLIPTLMTDNPDPGLCWLFPLGYSHNYDTL